MTEERRKTPSRARAHGAVSALEDRRAHARLDTLQEVIAKHLSDHAKYEKAIADNTDLIKKIVENTSKLVTLYEGAVNFRNFLIWVSPVVVIIAGVVVWVRSF